MWLVKSLSFFSFFLFFLLCFATCPGRISSPIGTIHKPKRVFPAKDLPFADNIRLHLWGQTPQKISQKWAGISISQPNRKSRKIITYWWPIKLFASNFTDRLRTVGIIEKNTNLDQRKLGGRNVTGRCNVTYFWNWGTPSISRERFKLETSNLTGI